MRILALAAFGIAAPALGQPEVLGTWVWEVTTQDGDAIVEPGETATFTLSMDFTPNVGERGLTGGDVIGLRYLEFDTLGMAGADQGQVLGWTILNDLDIDKGDLTTTDGISLFGTIASQAVFGGPFTPDDPIDVIEVEWAPSHYDAFFVSYQTSTLQLLVWEGPLDSPQAPEWPVEEAIISFQVIPSPSSALLISCALVVTGRRRRP